MKKEVKKEDETTKQINQLHNILDKNYFHVCVSLTEGNNIEWTVFYNNLDEEDYISSKNKPLLTSKRNTVADIYRLKNKFEELKKKQRGLHCLELFHDCFNIHQLGYQIKEEAHLGMTNIFLIYTTLNIFTINFANKTIASILNLILCISMAIYYYRKIDKLYKLLDNQDNITEEIILRNIIKRKGLNFVKELRHEMYRNELPKREKQTKKTTTKNI